MQVPQTDNTAITHHQSGGMTLTGDAMLLYRGLHVQKAIELYIKTKMVMTRGATIKFLLGLATEFTKVKYKNNAEGWAKAAADMKTWNDTMKAAIPVVESAPIRNPQD